MIELFNEKYIHWRYDERLKGEKVYAADSIYAIKTAINGNPNSSLYVTGIVTGGENDSLYPFNIAVDGQRGQNAYLFVYWDPLLKAKQAWAEGKRVLQYDKDNNEWVDVPDNLSDWDDGTRYEIVPESVNPDGRIVTQRELAYWCAKGYGEIRYNRNSNNTCNHIYPGENQDVSVEHGVMVRKWSDRAWFQPTLAYCFPEGSPFKEVD